ncbi:MAG: hypothetical protein N2A97_06480 [Thermodesulfobacteriales bacterium]
MDTGILWSLIGSFTNVFILTRIAQYFFKRFTKVDDRKRAFIVFFIVAVLDLIGLLIALKDKGMSSGLYYWLFFFMPFLVMWLLKDLMEASRKKKQEEAAQEEQSVK